jgi:anti-sigma B factor antagonist
VDRICIRLVEANFHCTLIARGELDLATAPLLERAAARLCSEGAKKIVLDLRPLDFCDVAGLHALHAARAGCQHSGVGFGVVPGEGQVRRLLEITGFFERLERQPRLVKSVA